MTEKRQDDWQERMAVAFGARVKEVRQRAGMGVQEVANHCTEFLGFKMLRTTLANLEAGTRKSVTIGEVIALADALRVSPLVLLFPPAAREDEEAGTVEYLPGQYVAPLEAWQRFTAPLFDMLGSSTGSPYTEDPAEVTAGILAAFSHLESSWHTYEDLMEARSNKGFSLQMRAALSQELSEVVSNASGSLAYLQEVGATIDGLFEEKWVGMLENRIREDSNDWAELRAKDGDDDA